jgi:hypothetical protein
MLLLQQRSQRHFAGSLLALLVLVLLQLQAFTASAASAASATWVRRGGSAAAASLQTASAPVLSLGPVQVAGRTRRQRRWLYLVGVPTHEGTDEATGGSGRPTNGNNNVVAGPYGTGGAGGAGKALASETASMAAGTAAAASTTASKTKPARNATSPTTDSGNETATSPSTSSTARKSKPSAASTNSSQDAIDDASGVQDDDNTTGASPAHYSQWDVTNATDFDAMLKNQTYRGPGLLPPDDADPPPHWDVAMAAFFGGLAVLLCLGTAVRRYRNQQRQRASYEPIHNLTV